jgi:hypothetical protein
MIELALGVANAIPFVLVDENDVEVTGLGDGFAASLSKNGGSFAAGVGARSELGDGWYLYVATGEECDTVGALALRVTGSGVVQQNLLLRVAQMASGPGGIQWSYILTSSVDGAPIGDARVWVTTDVGGQTVVASGRTDAFGVVTFWLDAGTYYVWRQKSGWSFENPDVEVVG